MVKVIKNIEIDAGTIRITEYIKGFKRTFFATLYSKKGEAKDLCTSSRLNLLEKKLKKLGFLS